MESESESTDKGNALFVDALCRKSRSAQWDGSRRDAVRHEDAQEKTATKAARQGRMKSNALSSEWVTNAIYSKQRREPSTHVTVRDPPVLAG